MYTRVVELTTKPGKARELAEAITDKVLPILKQQTGFVDETVLVSDTELHRVLALSSWNSKENAERYHREQYARITDLLKPFLVTEPVVRTFDVHTSTTHKIAASEAA
jgi:quinol monooxygenase YgiN